MKKYCQVKGEIVRIRNDARYFKVLERIESNLGQKFSIIDVENAMLYEKKEIPKYDLHLYIKIVNRDDIIMPITQRLVMSQRTLSINMALLLQNKLYMTDEMFNKINNLSEIIRVRSDYIPGALVFKIEKYSNFRFISGKLLNVKVIYNSLDKKKVFK